MDAYEAAADAHVAKPLGVLTGHPVQRRRAATTRAAGAAPAISFKGIQTPSQYLSSRDGRYDQRNKECSGDRVQFEKELHLTTATRALDASASSKRDIEDRWARKRAAMKPVINVGTEYMRSNYDLFYNHYEAERADMYERCERRMAAATDSRRELATLTMSRRPDVESDSGTKLRVREEFLRA